ncbi:MAG: hypothetical protein ACK40C_13865 [Novosphingobium meiothermophilum]
MYRLSLGLTLVFAFASNAGHSQASHNSQEKVLEEPQTWPGEPISQVEAEEAAAAAASRQPPLWPGTPISQWPGTPIEDEDKDGICGPWVSEREVSFAQMTDAISWRRKYQRNCWWQVFRGSSTYYIRTFDWGTVPKLLIEGVKGPPTVEIWVKGMHENDKGIRHRTSLTLYRIGCPVAGSNRQAILQFIAYDRENRVIEQWERPNAEPKAPLPGSKEEAFTFAVCSERRP